MKILFIDCCSVVRPAAHTNRLLSLARGCREAGHEVAIFCLGRAEGALREQLQGDLSGVSYRHIGRVPLVNKKPAGLIGKLGHFLYVLVLGGRCFKDTQADAVVIMNLGSAGVKITGLALMYKYVRLAKRMGVSVFHERNEYPHLGIHSWIDRILLWMYLGKILPQLDGIAVMTKAIYSYLEKNVSVCPPMIHLPMTVEPERFALSGERPVKTPYIAYCGTVFNEKDGVPILVKAFAEVASEIDDICLVLIGGDLDQEGMDSIRVLVKEMNLKKRVIFTGGLSREDVAQWLSHAEVLALARPANLQAAGGFPTKLGEYLSTGQPVVVTATGEIPEYLRNEENAWIVVPDSISAFSEQLKNALEKKDMSMRIGKAGKDVALSVFNYRVQGRRFSNFMEGIVKNSKAEVAG